MALTAPPSVIGIYGESIQQALGPVSLAPRLAYDRYDLAWSESRVTHLVIEAHELQHLGGWEHALTLRDLRSTVELAILVQSARASGLSAILVLPPAETGYRYPLISRLIPLFDRCLSSEEFMALAQQWRSETS